MTDFTYVAPPEDGLRRAMGEARRRRFRSAGMSTGATAAVIAIAAAVVGAQGSQSLMQRPVEQLPAVTGIDHGDKSSTRDVGTPTSSLATSTVTFTTTTTFTAGAQSTTSGSSATGLSPATAGRQAPTARTAMPYAPGNITRSENGLGVPSCTVDASHNQVANQLCPSTSISAGSAPYQLYADICSTRTSTSLLHYMGHNDVDFAIYRGGHELWRWSQWHPDGGTPHTLSLGAGYCTSWTFDWTGVDARGKALPPGSYTLRTTLLADEFMGHDVYSYDFTL